MHIDQVEVINRFESRSMTEEQQHRSERLRVAAKVYAAEILKLTSPSREQSVALTKLEEASFFVTAAVAREDG